MRYGSLHKGLTKVYSTGYCPGEITTDGTTGPLVLTLLKMPHMITMRFFFSPIVKKQEASGRNPLPPTSCLLIGYTQPVGFGSPAYLQACLAGPSGKSSYRYFVLPFSGPMTFAISFTRIFIIGAIWYF